MKPSERTPRTALLLGEVLAESGLPAGAFHVLPCDRTVSEQLVRDERVKLLSFTGSPTVGWALKAMAGTKRVVLELGSNSAVAVEPDAELEDAATRIVNGAFGYAGQSCISVQRIFLHATIADAIVPILIKKTEALVVGSALDEATDVGPMIDEAAAVRVEKWVRESGGTVLIGGKRTGSTLMPTLVRRAAFNSKLVCEEAFGPVAVIDTYQDFSDVLSRINASTFGLQAGIFTRNLHKARLAFERLDVGGVVINDVPTTRIDNMPYGGVKNSGLGREGVKYAMEEMTERKVMLTRLAAP